MPEQHSRGGRVRRFAVSAEANLTLQRQGDLSTDANAAANQHGQHEESHLRRDSLESAIAQSCSEVSLFSSLCGTS
jgi:hypothetical protein